MGKFKFDSETGRKAQSKRFTATIEERFWLKVKKTPTCWLWMAAATPSGYGLFRIGTRKSGKLVYAHRFIFSIIGKPLTELEEGDHMCSNKNCIRPSPKHVVRVPRQHNHDSPSFINKLKTHCLRGHLLAGDNLKIYSGKRICLNCQKMKSSR